MTSSVSSSRESFGFSGFHLQGERSTLIGKLFNFSGVIKDEPNEEFVIFTKIIEKREMEEMWRRFPALKTVRIENPEEYPGMSAFVTRIQGDKGEVALVCERSKMHWSARLDLFEAVADYDFASCRRDLSRLEREIGELGAEQKWLKKEIQETDKTARPIQTQYKEKHEKKEDPLTSQVDPQHSAPTLKATIWGVFNSIWSRIVGFYRSFCT